MIDQEKNRRQTTPATVRPDKKYCTIFFDLDHTLWDYETNSCATLSELYVAYDLRAKGIPEVQPFLDQFRLVNNELWDLFDTGRITSDVIRKERFKRILGHFSIDDEKLDRDLSADYLDQCPRKPQLMPYAIEVLDYLSERYRLTVITNGFEEIQHLKIAAGNLGGYFDHVVTSQKAGHRKPAREIFEYALHHCKTPCHEAIMIGDNLITDIGGARGANIDAVFFNAERRTHQETLDFEISSLIELKHFL
jgi:putative hydrolase of the HAD superfamily